MTFIRPLNVLDVQSSFDTIFSVNSTILCHISRNQRQCTAEDIEYFVFKVLNFTTFIVLYVLRFCPSEIGWHSYV